VTLTGGRCFSQRCGLDVFVASDDERATKQGTCGSFVHRSPPDFRGR